MADLSYPAVAGKYYGFSSIVLKLNGLSFRGFKSINYSRKRSRGRVMGNHPDPIAWTRGENEYTGDCELYLPEWNLFQSELGGGEDGYGDVPFTVVVTYGENGFDTIIDELIGCHMDSTDASNGQGTDPLVRKFDLNPLKIIFNKQDDLEFPLEAP